MTIARRGFLAGAGASILSARALGQSSIVQPFANGERPLVRLPQKRPLIGLTARPPQVETPFAVFNEGLLTPNDAFFVRYHLTNAPPPEGVLTPEKFRVEVKGKVNSPLRVSVEDLKKF